MLPPATPSGAERRRSRNGRMDSRKPDRLPCGRGESRAHHLVENRPGPCKTGKVGWASSCPPAVSTIEIQMNELHAANIPGSPRPRWRPRLRLDVPPPLFHRRPKPVSFWPLLRSGLRWWPRNPMPAPATWPSGRRTNAMTTAAEHRFPGDHRCGPRVRDLWKVVNTAPMQRLPGKNLLNDSASPGRSV